MNHIVVLLAAIVLLARFGFRACRRRSGEHLFYQSFSVAAPARASYDANNRKAGRFPELFAVMAVKKPYRCSPHGGTVAKGAAGVNVFGCPVPARPEFYPAENPRRTWAVAPLRLLLKIVDEGLGHVPAVKAAAGDQGFGHAERHVGVVCIAEIGGSYRAWSFSQRILPWPCRSSPNKSAKSAFSLNTDYRRWTSMETFPPATFTSR